MNMSAVVAICGKQFTVKEGNILKLCTFNNSDSTNNENKKNELQKEIILNEVKMLFNDKGEVLCKESELKNAKIKALLIDSYKGKKQVVFKKKRRQGYRRLHNHRQRIDVLKIISIENSSISA